MQPNSYCKSTNLVAFHKFLLQIREFAVMVVNIERGRFMNFYQQKVLGFPPFDDDFFNLFRIYLDEGSVPDCDGIHRHDFLEILYCRSNCGAVFRLNNRDYSLQRGDILLIPPNTPHGWLQRSGTVDPYMGYRVCIEPSAVELLFRFAPNMDIRLLEEAFIRTGGTIWESSGDLFRVLYEETHFRTIGWESSAFAAVLSLQTNIGRALHYGPTMALSQEKSDFYQSVLSYVVSILSGKLTLEDIAQRFWVSPSTITNLFNKHAGTSFYKFVTSLRLSEAKNLMVEGMPMEKIALRGAIDRLPEEERKAILLRFFKGLTQSQTARILQVSQVQVSRLERRALDRLRTEFGQ